MHVKKFPNVRTNSHPRCTRENGVLVANVAIIVIIVDTNFALEVRVTFNMSVTLFKVSLKVSSALCERSVHSVRVWVWHQVGHIWQPSFMTAKVHTNIWTNKTILQISVHQTNIRLFSYSFLPHTYAIERPECKSILMASYPCDLTIFMTGNRYARPRPPPNYLCSYPSYYLQRPARNSPWG